MMTQRTCLSIVLLVARQVSLAAAASKREGNVQYHNCWKMWWGSTWCCSAAERCSEGCPAGFTHTVQCGDWYGVDAEQCIPDAEPPSNAVCRSSLYGLTGSCSTSPSVPDNCFNGDKELSLDEGCCVDVFAGDSPFGGCSSGANAGNEKKKMHRRCSTQDSCSETKSTFEIWSHANAGNDDLWRTTAGCDSDAQVTPNLQPCKWCQSSNSLFDGCWLPYYITGNDRCIAASTSGSFTSDGAVAQNSGGSAVELVSHCNDDSGCKGTGFCQKEDGVTIGFCQPRA